MAQHVQSSGTTIVPKVLAYQKYCSVPKMRCKIVIRVGIELPTDQEMRFEFLTVVSFKILEEHVVSLFRSCFVLCVRLVHYSAEILVPTLGWGNEECIQNLAGKF